MQAPQLSNTSETLLQLPAGPWRPRGCWPTIDKTSAAWSVATATQHWFRASTPAWPQNVLPHCTTRGLAAPKRQVQPANTTCCGRQTAVGWCRLCNIPDAGTGMHCGWQEVSPPWWAERTLMPQWLHTTAAHRSLRSRWMLECWILDIQSDCSCKGLLNRALGSPPGTAHSQEQHC